MRKIKFRGKRLHGEKGQWVHGSLVIADPFRMSIYEEDSGYNFRLVAIDRNTVGQFTGLRDYKGREIYEGDEVHIYEREPFVEGEPRWNRVKGYFKVYWSEHYLAFRLQDPDGVGQDFDPLLFRYEVVDDDVE